MKAENSRTVEKCQFSDKIWLRGSEDYVRTELADILSDGALVYGYGAVCSIKPRVDESRGGWVAMVSVGKSCD